MGQQTQRQYDSLSRATRVSYVPNGQEGACQRVYYWYDGYPYGDALTGLGSKPIGRVTGMYPSGGPETGCA